jgi:general secretion pathway protein D
VLLPRRTLSALVFAAAVAGIAVAQIPLIPPGGTPPVQQQPQPPQPPPAQTPPATPQAQPPAQAQPANPAAGNPAVPGAQTPAPAPLPGTPTVFGGLSLNNVSLAEVIDLLARQLKLNIILDPRVRGGVILNTYGEVKDIDTRSLLDTILKLNGAALVQQGSIYRVVPLNDISHLAMPPETKTDSHDIVEDDQPMFNLIFLKYVTANELADVLKPFVGEGASLATYPPANLLLILDSRRSMRRTMDLIALFDSDQLANQRVRVFEVRYGRPTDLAKELDSIEKSISLSEKNSPIKFLPIDRINTIIAVAPNPGAFVEVEKWLGKLDTPVKVTAGAINNYAYHVRYGDATSIACSIQALYGQLLGFGGAQSSIAQCMSINGSTQGAGGGGLGTPLGGVGSGMPGSMPGSAYPGFSPNPNANANLNPYGQQAQQTAGGVAATGNPFGGANQLAQTGTDLTGQYLGNSPVGGGPFGLRPRVVANPFNNTLLIMASSQDYENIQNLLKDLDVPPRQVLIEAKIYTVDISHAFSSNVSSMLQQIAGNTPHTILGSFGGGTTSLTLGALVGKSREVESVVTLMENENRAKQIAAPAVIATDSIPATISVGSTVPTLSGEAVTGAQSNGTSLFANSVSNVQTGTNFGITARVTPSGIVTMIVNQQVSAPQPISSSATGIAAQTPSFSTQGVSTQITVQDGDTVAIGGVISESSTVQMSGIPLLHRIPVFGALFGSRSYSTDRSELVIFLTPHVIYDSTQMVDATDEIKARLKGLRKDVQE